MSIRKFFILFLLPIFGFAESGLSWVGVDFTPAPETTKKTVFSVPYGSTDFVGKSKVVLNEAGEIVLSSDLLESMGLNGDSDTALENQFDFSALGNLPTPSVNTGVNALLNSNTSLLEKAAVSLPPIAVDPIYNNFESLVASFGAVYLSRGYLVIHGLKFREKDEFIAKGLPYQFLADYGAELNLRIEGMEAGAVGLVGQEILLSVSEEILILYPTVPDLVLGRQISFSIPEGSIDFVMQYQGFNDEATEYSFDIYSLANERVGDIATSLPKKTSLMRVESPVESLAKRIKRTDGFNGGTRFGF